MAESSTIDSALLTSSIKTIKLLTRIYQNQEKLLKQIDNIDKNQEQIKNATDRINQLPTKKDFDVLADGLLQFNDDSQKAFNTLTDAINSMDNSQTIKIIKKLIETIKSLRETVITLSANMNTLSDNVNTVHQDASDLSTLTMDSNSRVRSMDLRMAALIGSLDSEENESGNLSDDLKFLSALPNEGNVKVDEDEVKKRELDRKKAQLQGDHKRAKEKNAMIHDEFKSLLDELNEDVLNMPDGDQSTIDKTEMPKDGENHVESN